MVSGDRIFHGDTQHATAFRIHGGFPQLFRVHLAQTFIALNRKSSTRLFHQPFQRLLEAGNRLTAFATFNKRIFFHQTAQFLTQRADTAVFRPNHELVIQRIIGINAVRANADNRLKVVQFAFMAHIKLPQAAVLFVFVQLGNQRIHPTGHSLFVREIAFVQRRLINQLF